MPNREIGVKLLFYSSGLASWFFWYGIIKVSKIGDGNMLLMLLSWDIFIGFSVYSSSALVWNYSLLSIYLAHVKLLDWASICFA